MGARVLLPWSLKDHPRPSSILSRYICCFGWQGQDICSTLVNFRGRHVVLLSVVSSMWIAIKTHVNIIIVPAVEARPVVKMLVLHSVLIRPQACNVLSSSHVWSHNGGRSSRVSHTSSWMVWTCCWRRPSTGLRPPPQLTSDWVTNLIKIINAGCLTLDLFKGYTST